MSFHDPKPPWPTPIANPTPAQDKAFLKQCKKRDEWELRAPLRARHLREYNTWSEEHYNWNYGAYVKFRIEMSFWGGYVEHVLVGLRNGEGYVNSDHVHIKRRWSLTEGGLESFVLCKVKENGSRVGGDRAHLIKRINDITGLGLAARW